MPEPLPDCLRPVWDEVRRAEAKYPPFNSTHEGYAVIAEELDELWDAVKGNDHNQAIREAVHVAAMAVRFLRDIGAEPSQATRRQGGKA